MMKWHSIFHYSKLSINCPSGMYVDVLCCACLCVSLCLNQNNKIQDSSFVFFYNNTYCAALVLG